MTRSLASGNYTALQARRLIARDFVWFVVRDRSTGNPVTDGYWSDVGSISADVIDPETGSTVTRTFAGAAGLVEISDIPVVSNLTVQTITITLAQAASRVNDLVRTYDCKQGKVQVFRGLFDASTRVMVAPAFPRFAGTIDEAPVTTPKEGETGDVTLTCTGNTQELTRSNPDTRSDASQKLRDPADDFYLHTATVSEWQQYWGKDPGVLGVTGGSPGLVALTRGAGLVR
ncbi:hypothetical protein [Bradyrhizobium cosmicum]|uniref:hypothetical protein n=1 Tax=Bradyrhizobium cosmicum TaxID=1404864 RepID=UPI001164470B|nr:hypothetical protein [Bradyrhizobium cosmicum]QDP20659.1 hypothetical protein FNV92_00170 [Bradyrhizobium cosmicum]QDP27009.1 hypothetical protein FNV92_34865 [Bradyrhizobium cosmicum]